MTVLVDTEVSRLNSTIVDSLQRLAEIQLEKKWHESQPIMNTIGSQYVGMYMILHHDEVMYIGMGNLNGRRWRHVSVFENKGEALVSENGRSSDSPVARKMYEYDKDINNWRISFMTIDRDIDRFVADAVMKKIECILNQEHSPVFCTEHMVGK